MRIVKYSDKSFAIFGEETKAHIDELRLYGIYNRGLTLDGGKATGWVFPNKHLAEVLFVFGLENSPVLIEGGPINILGSGNVKKVDKQQKIWQIWDSEDPDRPEPLFEGTVEQCKDWMWDHFKVSALYFNTKIKT